VPHAPSHPALLAQALPTLSHPHPLVRVEGRLLQYPGSAAACDACKRRCLVADYHCAACGFDLCDACFTLAASAGACQAAP
jgi:hypothetical protein